MLEITLMSISLVITEVLNPLAYNKMQHLLLQLLN